MKTRKTKTVGQRYVALLLTISSITCACLSAAAWGSDETRAEEVPCASATPIVEGCEIEGMIKQGEFDSARGRWAPLRAVIKMTNTSDDGRKLSFFCQIISQDSKNHSDVFLFSEGTYEMSIAPRETLVREFPFIDLMASLPSGYTKDTIAIRLVENHSNDMAITSPSSPARNLRSATTPSLLP